MQFAVSGYYGCGNAGDEAVLAGIQEGFRRQAGDRVRLIVLSQRPEETQHLHGVAAVDRMSLSLLRTVLRDADLLLSGGGSLLQDTTSVRSLLYYLWVARLAYSQGTPVMFYAQGLGPLRRRLSRTLVRIVADRAAWITLRDEPSAQLMRQIGVTNPRLEVTADPAFCLTPAPAVEVDALMQSEGIPTDAPLIGVALRPWGGQGESPVPDYARLLIELQRQTGARVLLIPMHAGDDVAFAEKVIEQTAEPGAFCLVRGSYAPSLLLGLTGRLQAMVAMRLHALIFAARMAVPLFALSYDPKVENLMRSLCLPNCLEHWRGFDPEETAGRVRGLLEEREVHGEALRVLLPDLERRALRNAECALTLFPTGNL